MILALLGCAAPPPLTAPGVVIVVMDTVRRDHLSTYGHDRPTSPALDALAAQGTRYDRAYSTSSWTLPAHASLFTGLLPEDHGATQTHLKLRGRPPLLAGLLAEAGWQTAAFSNNPWVGPSTGLTAGFATFGPMWKADPPPWWAPWAGHPTVDAVEDWLAGLDPARPFFLFVNLIEAHGPYVPDDADARAVLGRDADLDALRARYGEPGELGLTRAWYLADPPVAPEVVEAARDLYDGEVRRVDATLGAIVDAVDRRADPSRVLVVATTDHGEHFGEHGHVGHAFSVHEELLRVALVARGPGFAPGSTHDGLVQLPDVFTTALAHAGLPQPRRSVGRDLRDPPDPERSLRADYDFPEQVLDTFPAAVRDAPALDRYRVAHRVGLLGPHKLIRDSAGRESVYDLATDPGEARDLAPAADPALLDRLRLAAGTPEPPPARARAAPVAPGDAEDREALRQLGYLE